MSVLKCAVIGVGYLGRFHAQKYHALPNVQLFGVCDINAQTATTVAQELNVPVYTDYHALLNEVDVVSIAATTNMHYEIAKECLLRGIHVLVEKPITETVLQANELIALARAKHLKLQVGHLERFNATRLAIDEYLTQPLFIESNRLAPFNPRGTDVNVVLDLMIHDIDLIQGIVKSPLVSIDAHGAPVLSKSIDIANARLTFKNHCVANITASRISFKTERKTRLFQPNSYLSIDYQNKEFAVFEKGQGSMFPGIPDIVRRQSTCEKGDALLEEIKAFLASIENDTTPLVTGEEGRDALAVAADITRLIDTNLSLRYACA